MVGLLCLAIGSGAAQADRTGVVRRPEFADRPGALLEYRVKAAFLYNFAKFSTWPAETREQKKTLSFCVAGNPGFAEVLARSVVNKSIHGRSISVISLDLDNEPAAASCNVLYVNGEPDEQIASLLGSLEGLPVLTVGHAPDFARNGVIVNFYKEENKIRFEINLDAAARVHLRLSSKLLGLARIVNDG